jgi:hypothetical protein
VISKQIQQKHIGKGSSLQEAKLVYKGKSVEISILGRHLEDHFISEVVTLVYQPHWDLDTLSSKKEVTLW